MGEEGVLLGFVETVDLVDEQDGPLTGEGLTLFCRLDDRSQLGDAAGDG